MIEFNPDQHLPSGSEDRKAIPIVSGVLDYFPNAIAAVAEVSKHGNDKHNPGQDLHWSRNKSTDHRDCIGRHLLDSGKVDPETGVRHSAELAWRALANLEEELIAAGATPGRGTSNGERSSTTTFAEVAKELIQDRPLPEPSQWGERASIEAGRTDQT